MYADTGDEEKLRAHYEACLALPGYQTLREHTTILGTWDDHDYGVNNGGKEWTAKDMSQRLFLDFFNVPSSSSRRTQAGIYHSTDIGTGSQRIRIITLDCRYHREQPGATADILGETQWAWLEQQLSTNPAPWTIIVSGIQVLAAEHRYEKWAQFPQARARLLALLSTCPSQPIIISGDRHIAEISAYTTDNGRTIYDITSSGMTHSWRNAPPEANALRFGPRYTGRNIGTIQFDWTTSTAHLRIIPVIPTEAPARLPTASIQLIPKP